MAFSFGNTGGAKPSFGSSASTPASSGLFGGTTTTTSTSGFGGFGGFSGNTTSAGTSGFGGFGATTTTAPSTGFGGFGGFGTATTTQSTLGTGFGTSTHGTALGSTGFGTGGGLGTGTSTGFGTGTSGFGTGTSTGFGTGTTGFGTGTSTGFGTGTSGFGTGTSTFGAGTGGFGTGTGFGTSTSTSGFGFGGGNTLGGMGQTAQQQAQQKVANEMANMASAVSMPLIFGDERDALIAKWNQLQAFWGFGEGFFNQQGNAVQFKSDNPFCRFKAVGYSCLPSTRNRDGIVVVVFNREVDTIQTNQSQIVLTLHKILGSKPNLTVCVEGTRPLPDDKTEMALYIQERSATGVTKRLLASEVFTFMNQQNIKSQLGSQLAVCELLPKTGLTGEQLKTYLDNPPSGIDPLIWRQAKLDNPDPDKLIPVAMIGFTELQRRLKHQEQQTKLHTARLNVISQDISTLQQKHTDMLAKIEQYKRHHLELGHRVLKVMVRQEVYRKQGYSIQADEEQLRVMLEASQAQLNAPTQFKGRLNELMSQIRLQSQTGCGRMDTAYQMEEAVQSEVRQHLKQQQEGIQLLIGIIKDDLEDLRLIEQGLMQSESLAAR